MKTTLALLALFVMGLTSCSVVKHKDLVYNPEKQLKLDLYQPKKTTGPTPIVVFIHGGNWNSGSKNTYRFFAKAMAKKGISCATIDYRLAPKAKYDGMALDAAQAVLWIKDHCAEYGLDSSKLIVAGHSAGGHLATLISNDKRYYGNLGRKDPAKGILLIDAFGLDMYAYMQKKQFEYDTNYLPTFTTDPEVWKAGSPINYLHNDIPKTLMLLGTKTYKSIIIDNYFYWEALRKYQPELKMIQRKGKRHAGMIIQFAFPWSKAFDEVVTFIGESH